MELRHILWLIRKWFWMIILAGIIGGIAALGVSSFQPKVYEADATLFVNSPNRGDSGSVYGAQQAAKAFAQFPRSNSVLLATLQALNENDLSLSQLTSMVSVQNDLDTQFVIVKVRDNEPRRAARLATEIAKQSAAQFRISANDGSNTKDFVLQEMITLETQIKNLEVELASLEGPTEPSAPSTLTPSQLSRINQLTANLSDLRQAYDQLVNDYTNLNGTQVTLFQETEIPQVPIAPELKLAIAIGVLVGLIIILGVILFIEQNDDILRTPTKIAQATGLPTFITVQRQPEIAKHTPWLNGHYETIDDTTKGSAVGAKKAPLQDQNKVIEDAGKDLATVAQQAPTTVGTLRKDKELNGFQLSEAFLTLGVLLHGNPQLTANNLNSLLITSPENGDGKTVTAAQIALGLARTGREVVLVDANLRKPEVHNIFGLPNRVGLSSLLTSDIMFDPIDQMFASALQKTREPNLAILTSGPTIPSPPEALLSSKMTTILNQLSRRATVVVDSSALLTSSEPVILAGNCSSVLVVVNARRSSASKLNRSLELLQMVNTNVLGIVLNQVDNQM